MQPRHATRTVLPMYSRRHGSGRRGRWQPRPAAAPAWMMGAHRRRCCCCGSCVRTAHPRSCPCARHTRQRARSHARRRPHARRPTHQHRTVPVVDSTQLCSCPAASCVTLKPMLMSGEADGAAERPTAVTPGMPTWPTSLLPKARTRPSVRRTRQCFHPQKTSAGAAPPPRSTSGALTAGVSLSMPQCVPSSPLRPS